MTDVKALEIYYWTATLGSFSRAADCAKVTQPAVSQRIASLEREFGLSLIERGARTVSLTPKGRDLLVFAERFMRLHAEMMAAMIENGNTTGVLRLGVSETIAYTWLTVLIEKISKLFPQISVDTRLDVFTNLREALMRRELDIALLVAPVAAPTVIDVALGSFPVVWVASPQLQISSGRIDLDNIIGFPIITNSRETSTYAHIYENILRRKLPAPKIYTNGSADTTIRMVIDGMGIGAVPSVIVRDELASGKLQKLDISLVLPNLAYTACYLSAPDNRIAACVAQIALEVSEDWLGNRLQAQ